MALTTMQQEEEAEGEEEEEDDLANAFEILDLARVCYEKQLDQAVSQDDAGKGKDAASDSPALRHIKERLADTHDCLAEISLENERSGRNRGQERMQLTLCRQISKRHRGWACFAEVQARAVP